MVEIIAEQRFKDALAGWLSDIQDDAVLINVDRPDQVRGTRQGAHGLDDALSVLSEKTEMSRWPIVMIGFLDAADYAHERRWHAVMAYPNVEFARLPLSGDQIKDVITKAKTSNRPLDPLGQRWLEIVPVDD